MGGSQAENPSVGHWLASVVRPASRLQTSFLLRSAAIKPVCGRQDTVGGFERVVGVMRLAGILRRPAEMVGQSALDGILRHLNRVNQRLGLGPATVVKRNKASRVKKSPFGRNKFWTVIMTSSLLMT